MTRDVVHRTWFDGPRILIAHAVDVLDRDGWRRVVFVSHVTRRGG